MNATLDRSFRSRLLRSSTTVFATRSSTAVFVISLQACLLATAVSAQNAATTLPPFQRFPPDATTRLALAVEHGLQGFPGDFGGHEPSGLAAIGAGGLDRPELPRSLWQSIEGSLGAPLGAPLAAGFAGGAGTTHSAPRQGPAPLLDVVDGAIGAYMTELGRIAYDLDRSGDRDIVEKLAPLHPGEQGSGTIGVGTVGPFRQLEVSFRGEIAHPDGTSPAVVASFYLLPDRTRAPIPGRLLIPTTGARPSFRAVLASATGERETRDYGWRPRLARTSSILELMIDGRWTRVEDEHDVVPRRRTWRDPVGFCDAACVDR